MPAYKDSKTGTWFVKFYCKDWTKFFHVIISLVFTFVKFYCKDWTGETNR